MTGYRIDHSRMDILSLASGMLDKPFSPEAIAAQVEALLDRGIVGATEATS
jgi:DNA-binding response OmpR family regulator